MLIKLLTRDSLDFMQNKKVLLNLTQEELGATIKPLFRVKQIFNWVYTKYVDDFYDMQNLSKDMRTNLHEQFIINPLSIVDKKVSSDGTIKYLFKLLDGKTIESVLLCMKKAKLDINGKLIQQAKYTICVSTQVGCKIGCKFCLTGRGGFTRNLTAGEIVAQVLSIKRDNEIKARRAINIVYMGMGEPLDNFDNLVKAINIFASSDGLCISCKRQTVSTSGISTKIDALGKMNLGVNIAISLHAVDDHLRTQLIPMNKAYNIQSIIDAVKHFPINTRKRVMFEYLVIKDLNDDIKSAKKLIKLLHGIKAKVNLIYFNPFEQSNFERPSSESVERFAKYLIDHGLLATIRQSKGIDISAACGQLREKSMTNSKVN